MLSPQQPACMRIAMVMGNTSSSIISVNLSTFASSRLDMMLYIIIQSYIYMYIIQCKYRKSLHGAMVVEEVEKLAV